ncbi:MAG: restriction endonuclease subunit S [Nitrospirae bacterium]|nr:restriction endonuclease subunit S [Nitrospirota bacterium]
MQQANDLWIGSVPKEWLSFRIKDVTQLSPGLSSKAPQLTEPCTVVPMESVSEKGQIDTSTIEEYDFISGGLPNFEAGDVIFAKITPCMENGKGAYVESLPTRYAFGSTEFHVLRPGYKIDSKFLYYYTFNSVFREYAAVNMTGAAGQKRVSSRFLNYTRIFLPSVPEQRRIAAYLDKTCVAIDTAIEKKQKQLETLDALRKSIIHKAVTRGLDDFVELKDSGVEWIGKVPKHWRVEKLKRFLERPLMYGTNEAAELDDTEFPRYIRITDFDDYGSLRDDTFKSLPPDKAEGYYLFEGDVLFARSGATVGKTFLFKGYNGKACFAGYLIKAQTNKHKLLPEYLYYFTKSPSYDSWKSVIFTQATIQNISATKYAYLPIAVPPITEQRRILDYLAGKMNMLHVLQENLSGQLSALEQYRKYLIHECVTGKRRITEAHLKEIEAHV